MIAVPAAIIVINNDLTNSVRGHLEIQLHIDETITGAEFDSRVAIDPSYPSTIRQLDRRIMVIRDFREDFDRSIVDIVVFFSHGLIKIERNKFGPPGKTVPAKNLYWGQLCIFETRFDATHPDCNKPLYPKCPRKKSQQVDFCKKCGDGYYAQHLCYTCTTCGSAKRWPR